MRFYKKVPMSEKALLEIEHEEISKIAYFKWEEAGCPDGGGAAQVCWTLAEKEHRAKKADLSRWSSSRADTWPEDDRRHWGESW